MPRKALTLLASLMVLAVAARLCVFAVAEWRKTEPYERTLSTLLQNGATYKDVTREMGLPEALATPVQAQSMMEHFGGAKAAHGPEVAKKAARATRVAFYKPRDVVCYVYLDSIDRMTDFTCFPN